jgi:hypothetical protein
MKLRLNETKLALEALDDEKTVLELKKKKLTRLAQADMVLNESEQERQTSNPLKFGDTIQLKHKFSDKFLCVSEAKSAHLVHNAVRVFLQEWVLAFIKFRG